ncbi:TadE/TadG family type IV pilus assembly protein [Ciceribacter ferrooxidans]|uniref:Pilus assembly protein n=1 Tax=Ciceribacter ferrooxidans TaxID=2509717 RepID=A0A4Q2TWJ9_9HYPH|nr:TadE/TadG family type IV pilus assembly protein [Ciceribacter ferrooxidans]RYC23146.1 pilus assembly protein [Ciceribacter ferrooxidans]
MTCVLSCLDRARRCQSGTTAVEFALVGLPLFLLILGVVEFGRAFFLQNDLSYAADVAARQVLIGQVGPSLSETDATTRLDDAVRANFRSGDPALLQVTTARETVNGSDFRVLTLRYPFTFLLPDLIDTPITIGLSRRIPIG